MLNTLQVGRALAALMVVLHHSAQGANAFVGNGPQWAQAIAARGYLGVDFFFVLSGFIIFYTSQTKPTDVRDFFWRRLSRIFVPYLPIALFLIALYLALPGMSQGNRDWGWLPSLTLLPSKEPPALSVAWTLQHELVFYGIFAVLLATRQVATGLCVWALMIVLASATGLNVERPTSILLGQINLEFGMGVLAAMMFTRKWPIPNVALLVLACVFLGAFVALGSERDLSLLVGGSIACLIVPMCRMEARGIIRVAGWMVTMGNASYAIYLVHNPLVSVTSRLSAQISSSWWLAMAVGVAGSVALGLGYHLLYERPALRWTNALARRRWQRGQA